MFVHYFVEKIDLGLVDMTVQLKDREVNFQVSTIHAAVLSVMIFLQTFL